MTDSCLRSFGIVAVLIATEGCSLAQVQSRSSVPTSATREMMEQQLIRESVRAFLSVWLVNRDLDKAMVSFGEAAFQNKAMLQESCAGYIKAEERDSETARRAGITAFLQDFLPSKPAASLAEVLHRETISSVAAQLPGKLANDPQADLFALVRLTRAQLPVRDARDSGYLRRHLPSNFYASFVPIAEGIVYFLWVPEGKGWRIYHVSLVCM